MALGALLFVRGWGGQGSSCVGDQLTQFVNLMARSLIANVQDLSKNHTHEWKVCTTEEETHFFCEAVLTVFQNTISGVLDQHCKVSAAWVRAGFERARKKYTELGVRASQVNKVFWLLHDLFRGGYTYKKVIVSVDFDELTVSVTPGEAP